jgi:murein DD-endopeptidase MepM/ murein hydrolase activator NlpD
MGRPRNVLLLVATFGAVAWLVEGFMPQVRLFYELHTAPAPRALAVPVQGASAQRIRDSWHAPRGAGRVHQGVDIFAAHGTPVVSPVLGMVVGMGTDRLGGNVVRVLGPGGQVHYFAHLSEFAPIGRGQLVHPGQPIGYVGDTGNAKGTPPHLHYGIYGRSGAINPYPLLAAR